MREREKDKFREREGQDKFREREGKRERETKREGNNRNSLIC